MTEAFQVTVKISVWSVIALESRERRYFVKGLNSKDATEAAAQTFLLDVKNAILETTTTGAPGVKSLIENATAHVVEAD